MSKQVDLEITHEWLGEQVRDDAGSKKREAESRKELRKIRDRYPIEISIRFRVPWWANAEEDAA